eukprot:2944067-Pyramimonas_sp.AAC.1
MDPVLRIPIPDPATLWVLPGYRDETARFGSWDTPFYYKKQPSSDSEEPYGLKETEVHLASLAELDGEERWGRSPRSNRALQRAEVLKTSGTTRHLSLRGG